MKKYVLAISVILCTVMLGMAIAQEKANEQQKPDKAPMAIAKAQTGEVLSVDPTKNEIVIRDENTRSGAGATLRLYPPAAAYLDCAACSALNAYRMRGGAFVCV